MSTADIVADYSFLLFGAFIFPFLAGFVCGLIYATLEYGVYKHGGRSDTEDLPTPSQES